MDEASAYGAGDCRFESCRGHFHIAWDCINCILVPFVFRIDFHTHCQCSIAWLVVQFFNTGMHYNTLWLKRLSNSYCAYCFSNCCVRNKCRIITHYCAVIISIIYLLETHGWKAAKNMFYWCIQFSKQQCRECLICVCVHPSIAYLVVAQTTSHGNVSISVDVIEHMNMIYGLI